MKIIHEVRTSSAKTTDMRLSRLVQNFRRGCARAMRNRPVTGRSAAVSHACGLVALSSFAAFVRDAASSHELGIMHL